MISANAVMTGSYDHGEVARSILIAVVASYAALDLAGRVTAARGWTRDCWLAGGAIAMGIGIWAMHFKGVTRPPLAGHRRVPLADSCGIPRDRDFGFSGLPVRSESKKKWARFRL